MPQQNPWSLWPLYASFVIGIVYTWFVLRVMEPRVRRVVERITGVPMKAGINGWNVATQPGHIPRLHQELGVAGLFLVYIIFALFLPWAAILALGLWIYASYGM